jgi:putative transposase
VAVINSGECRASEAVLRPRFVNNDNFEHDNTWVKDVPYDVRNAALQDVVKAVKAYKAKKKDNQRGFRLHFRSARDPVQSITVHSRYWNTPRSAFTFLFSTRRLRGGKEYRRLLRNGLPHDSRLVRDKLGRYFLCVPFDRPIQLPPPTSIDRVVAIDPGVRTFLTTYDQDGGVHEWGKGDCARFYRLALHVDDINAKASKAKHKRRYRLRRAITRLYARIRNLTDEVHRKAARWLCTTYNTIVIPAFNSSQMVQKSRRRIHTKTVRSMLHWSHYRFRQRLLYTAEQHGHVSVHVVTEEYTSKSCGVCGALHHTLGGNKHFKCPTCDWECDRDVNGARNILLKTLTQLGAGQPLSPRPVQWHPVPPSSPTTLPHLLGGGALGPSPVFASPNNARLSALTETAEF